MQGIWDQEKACQNKGQDCYTPDDQNRTLPFFLCFSFHVSADTKK